MFGKIIISLVFIPINAVILWAVSNIGLDRQSYTKALIATTLLFIISLSRFISFQGTHAPTISSIIYYCGLIVAFFILWLIYRYDLKSLLFMWGIWVVLQIPFNIMQTKILNLPWDMMLQAF